MAGERRRLRVTGTVQGVGFRPFVYRHAVDLGLSGHVANDSLGVVIEVEGAPAALDELARRLVEDAPPLARVGSVESAVVHPEVDGPVAGPVGGPVRGGTVGGGSGFHIVDSRAEGAPAVAVSVDVGTCDDCLAELDDPDDRRFAYPFINCTNCGPRYTIILKVPYDRSFTTMADFTMCEQCRREYENPADRRFHAEPNACPRCGPRLRLLSPDGAEAAAGDDALDGAVTRLLAGEVLAVKGLGGYHLAADATQSGAVAALRARKARDDKPFALMVADLDAAGALCALTPEAGAVLSSPRRPIVLAPRAEDASVVPGVAPGLSELGLMMPYTPLHHLLLSRVGRPLVMTSGNQTDEPIAHDDSDAVARLGPMVDAILTHDRRIHIRCDDSVVRAGPTRTQMVRRSRGFAPEPLRLPGAARHQVLAVGAELKNTVAVAKGDNVIVSHHIGDLEHLAAHQSFLQAVDHLCRLTGVEPEVVAHDLHPEYLSTKFALDLDLPLLGVQHHHAHIASCLTEHGRHEPVLGVAFDGTGLGDDGTLWGGELLVADLDGYRRVGHLRPVPLPGGAQAIREPWRMALTWAAVALGGAEAERYGSQADGRWQAVLSLIDAPTTIRTTSAGRLFDAVAALLGLRLRVTYEAQAAIELEAAATGVPMLEGPAYPLEVADDTGMVVLDPSPMIAAVVADRDAGTPVALISARFHLGLGRAVARVVADLAAAEGLDHAALSGGVFQNARLSGIVVHELEAAGLRVLVHERVPPNDGGVSVGQAAIAARRA